MKCPECSHDIKLKGREAYASCPECLTRVNAHTGKEVVKQPSSFHHYDSLNGATFVEYITGGTPIVDPNATIQCLLCGVRKSELHMTRAALLKEGTIVKQQTLLSLEKEAKSKGDEIIILGNLGDIITRKVKIPRYISGHVCDSVDCTLELNHLCSQIHPIWDKPEAKLLYTQMSTLADNNAPELGLTREVEDVAAEEVKDGFVEYETKGKSYSLGIRYHRASDIGETSIQERAAKRSRVARLTEPTQNVNPKPSKKVRDMRKMVKG